jgi:iron complex transport system substrate-binding protein
MMQARHTKVVYLGLLFMLIMLLISACGGNNEGGTGDSTATNVSAGQQETSPQPTEEASEPTTKVVSTVMGDVEIPTEPKRIVALYYHHLLLAFDMKPVGANLTWWGGSPFLKDLESADIVDVGGPPSLEAVAKLDPDLIIMNSNNMDDYEQFAKIAPSVLLPYDAKNTPYDDARLLGEVLGKTEQADKLAARFEEKATAARAKTAGILDENTKVALIRIEGKGGQFSIFGSNYGRGGWSLYRGLNLKQPDRIAKELLDNNAEIVQQLSLELLPEYVADADYIFVSNEGEGLDMVKDNPIWNTIAAVKNNKVIELESKQYFFFDPISIEAQLDLITEMLLKQA